jgi:hypothetical protein
VAVVVCDLFGGRASCVEKVDAHIEAIGGFCEHAAELAATEDTDSLLHGVDENYCMGVGGYMHTKII